MIIHCQVWRWNFGIPEPRWIEAWAGMATLLWAGYVYFMPDSLGDVAPYRLLGGMMSDTQWARTGLIIGATQLPAAFGGYRWLRAVTATVGAIFWTILFRGISLEIDRSFPGVVLYLNTALMNLNSLICQLAVLIAIRRDYERRA